MVVDRALAGRARPYSLGELAYALRDVMSLRALLVLEWMLAAERGFSGKRGCVIKHADLARLIGCCERSAGAAMRELVDLGLLEQRPHFERADGERGAPDDNSWKFRWREFTPAYQTTAKCREVIARRDARFFRSPQVGKKYQPPETQLSLRESNKRCVRGRGRPERAFADQLQAPRTSRPVVLVSPDGKRFYPKTAELTQFLDAVKDAKPQKLVNEQGEALARRKAADTCEGAIAAAWAAFEARAGHP